jgi:hypothetical protein
MVQEENFRLCYVTVRIHISQLARTWLKIAIRNLENIFWKSIYFSSVKMQGLLFVFMQQRLTKTDKSVEKFYRLKINM